MVPGLSMVGMVVYETGKMRVTGRHSASFDDMVACFQRVFGLVEWRPPEEKAAPAPTAPKPEAAPKPGLPTEVAALFAVPPGLLTTEAVERRLFFKVFGRL